MASTALHPATAAHGGTALGPVGAHERHRLGEALHALRVYLSAAVDVVILGSESRPH